MKPTLTDLRTALQSNQLHSWLASTGLPEEARFDLFRAIDQSRPLWMAYPDALASLVLARSQSLPGTEALQTAWEAELRASGRPWLSSRRPLHPPPTERLAALPKAWSSYIPLAHRFEFRQNNLIAVEALRLTTDDPHHHRDACLLWRWRTGLIALKPFGEQSSSTGAAPHTSITRDRSGSLAMLAPGRTRPIPIPYPDGGTDLDALPSARQGLVLVYGTESTCDVYGLDFWDAGFIWIVRASTGEVLQKLQVNEPIQALHESADGSVLLAHTSEGISWWSRETKDSEGSSLYAFKRSKRWNLDSVKLSPNGNYLLTRSGKRLEVWGLDISPRSPENRAFPATFSPDGSRLISGEELFDGVTGERLASIPFGRATYLENGPAHPWFHFGNSQLVSLWSRLQAWSSTNGKKIECSDFRLLLPYAVSYNHKGDRLAAVHRGHSEVRVIEIPSAREAARLAFSQPNADDIALSPKGQLVALSSGPNLEVRSLEGQVRLEARHPVPKEHEKPRVTQLGKSSLLFVDEDHLASDFESDGWRLFCISDGRNHRIEDPKLGIHRDWQISTIREATIFEHRPSGTKLALPFTGEWKTNPKKPTILACDQAHIELIPPNPNQSPPVI